MLVSLPLSHSEHTPDTCLTSSLHRTQSCLIIVVTVFNASVLANDKCGVDEAPDDTVNCAFAMDEGAVGGRGCCGGGCDDAGGSRDSDAEAAAG